MVFQRCRALKRNLWTTILFCLYVTGPTVPTVNSVKASELSVWPSDQQSDWADSYHGCSGRTCPPGFVCELAASAQRTHSRCQVAMCLQQREGRTKKKNLSFGRRCFKPPNCHSHIKERRKRNDAWQYSTVNNSVPEIQITNLPRLLPTSSAWAWLQETKKPVARRKPERRSSHWFESTPDACLSLLYHMHCVSSSSSSSFFFLLSNNIYLSQFWRLKVWDQTQVPSVPGEGSLPGL